MSATFTVSVGADFKSIVLTISSLTGGYTSDVYVKRPGAEDYDTTPILTGVSATTYTLYMHLLGIIDTSSADQIMFNDGVWEFYIHEYDSGTPPTVSDSAAAYGFCSGYARCALGLQIGALATKSFEEDCCQDCLTEVLHTMYLLLDSATYDASLDCGDYSAAQKKIDKVNAYCAQDSDCRQTNCKDCN